MQFHEMQFHEKNESFLLYDLNTTRGYLKDLFIP